MNCPECSTQNHGNSKSCKSCGLEFESKEIESKEIESKEIESKEIENPKPVRPSYSEMLKTRFVLWGAGALGFVIGSMISGGSVWGGIGFGILGFGCGYYILSKRKRN